LQFWFADFLKSDSGVIARNSGVIVSGYIFCILLLQHTSVDPAFFEFSGVFAEFRRFYKLPA
jgi:hypothetical protein